MLIIVVMIIPYLLMYIVYTFLGHICERHNNPADFFLDVISANESSVTEGTYNMLATTC